MMKTTSNARTGTSKMGLGRAVILLLALIVLVASVLVYAAYQRDIRRARQRIATGSQLIETACGRIEYAVAGSGAPLLLVHGAGGGYDQGLDAARDLSGNGYQVIAMSRFGYLRTPLPADASPAAQADAHACLLDALHVRRAAVLGLSAGGPSAMQFALRYPERTSALVLLVPAAYPMSLEQAERGAKPTQTSALAGLVFDAALKSDFLFWAAPRLAPQAMYAALLATPAQDVESASAEERLRVARVLDHLLPFTSRLPGIINDAANENPLPRYEVERITAPALILSAADDLYGTALGAKYTADHMPNARFVGYPDGGHLLVGHYEEAMAEVLSFLRSQAQ